MQRRKSDEIHLGKTVFSFDSIGNSKVIDRTASGFDNADQKVEKHKRLVRKRECNEDVAPYIPCVLNFIYQAMLKNVKTKKQPAVNSYARMENSEFRTMLTQNHYTDPNCVHLCFPIKI